MVTTLNPKVGTRNKVTTKILSAQTVMVTTLNPNVGTRNKVTTKILSAQTVMVTTLNPKVGTRNKVTTKILSAQTVMVTTLNPKVGTRNKVTSKVLSTQTTIVDTLSKITIKLIPTQTTIVDTLSKITIKLIPTQTTIVDTLKIPPGNISKIAIRLIAAHNRMVATPKTPTGSLKNGDLMVPVTMTATVEDFPNRTIGTIKQVVIIAGLMTTATTATTATTVDIIRPIIRAMDSMVAAQIAITILTTPVDSQMMAAHLNHEIIAMVTKTQITLATPVNPVTDATPPLVDQNRTETTPVIPSAIRYIKIEATITNPKREGRTASKALPQPIPATTLSMMIKSASNAPIGLKLRMALSCRV